MADREAEDTPPAPAREAKAADPLARVHANAAIILACLAHYHPDARWGTPEELTFLVVAIEDVARWARTWTPQRVGRARYEAARRTGASVPKPAQIWPPPAALIVAVQKKQQSGRETFAERHFREGLETLAERNAQNAPVRVTRPRLSPQGALPKRWGLALRAIAPNVAATVAQHGGRVTTGPKAPFTKSCRDLLAIILPDDKLPSLSTLSDALRKIIVIDGGN